MQFCKKYNIEPFNFSQIGLEEIEQLTETHILSNINTVAPKSLNVTLNAVKAWCFTLRMLKNRKLFREIKFDKQSRQTDAMTEKPLETEHIAKLMQVSDAFEQIELGLCGLCGLRPALVPQLKIKDLHPEEYTIENGKLHFKTENPFLYVSKEYEGNKAHVTFFVIIPSKIAQQLEYCINSAYDTVTAQSQLVPKYAQSAQTVYQKNKELFERIGFTGRPYLLRTYADRLLDRQLGGPDKKDEDLKEFMLGHKGKISMIYQMKALTHEDKSEYLKQYRSVNKYINEKIFGLISNEELNTAQAMATFAESIGVPKERIAAIYDLLMKSKLRLVDYEKQLKTLTQETMTNTMKAQIRNMMQEIQQEST
jgi:integrase